ncbi:hypothetical protein HMJ29_01265 [Hymenobacter taeanensis]|uniref:STAS/SEC14 domain-containing protein n=1 Tax=Hymenobacter taeanensis TaxID=2735321 RepID=A0A6M6BBQ4_9BACT|nr:MULTISPECIES: hypothetical protein [Hymenobacter]QJX45636.1 hypothetical protein HMJ29_01265 [Hymenobacter taeanensis]UOQ79472.1 hypothetical protein MUN83_11450 [Hymenobacter sp. 5414T-23]
MPVLASNPSLVLHLHPGPLPTLETEWLAFVNSTDFRRYVEEALVLAKQHGVKAWVANDQRLGAVRPVDLRWVSEYVLPAIAELGVLRFARLESGETLNRLLIGNMYQGATQVQPFEVRTFTNLPQARAWASGADTDVA